ncbi:MAG TPA: hypothetical protein VGE09_06395 [Pseudoxanthomonas sp.]
MSPLQQAAFAVLGIFAAVAWNQGYSAPAPAPVVELVITDARTCAAAAAYAAPGDDTGLQAAFATVALNKAASPTPADCGPSLVLVMADDFDPVRWQRALDLVDSVRSGDYALGQDACARANEVIPPVASSSPSDAQARAQCVISGYAFVERAL